MKYIVKVLDAKTGEEVDSPIECDGVAIMGKAELEGENQRIYMRDMDAISLMNAIHEDKDMHNAAVTVIGLEKRLNSLRGKWALWRASRKARKSGE